MLSRDPHAAEVRIPPPLVYALSIGTGWLLDNFVVALPVPFMAPVWLSVFAAILASIGIVMLTYATGLFLGTGQNPEPWKTTPSLVVTGVYGWTRNPMYVGMALLQLAIGLYLDNAWVVALTIPSLLAVLVIAVIPEELYLTHKFATEYVRYKERVRRWL
jgi:protein-S-isoprenylcysteine O-methyltransferase Ste14